MDDHLTLYLLRHGETAWTLSGQHTGVTDLPLGEAGQAQALRLKNKLQTISFAKIFSSPRKRALQSAELSGFQPQIEPLAVEWDYGNYEGLTSQEIWKKDPHWELFKDGAPGGESLSQITERADLLLNKLMHEKGTIALFSHGHFSRVLAARWIGLSSEWGRHFALGVASISILGYERNGRVIRLWNEL